MVAYNGWIVRQHGCETWMLSAHCIFPCRFRGPNPFKWGRMYQPEIFKIIIKNKRTQINIELIIVISETAEFGYGSGTIASVTKFRTTFVYNTSSSELV